MKSCLDCRWFKNTTALTECHHPSLRARSRNGWTLRALERLSEVGCGPRGTKFEPLSEAGAVVPASATEIASIEETR